MPSNKTGLITGRNVYVIPVAIALLIIAVLGWTSLNFDKFVEKTSYFQSQKINKSYLDRGSLGKLFRQLGLIRSEKHHLLQSDMGGFSTTLVVGITVAVDSQMQLFWDVDGSNFTDKNSHKINLAQGHTEFALGLPPLQSIRQLRFDFVNKPQNFSITKIHLSEPGFTSLKLTPHQFKSAVAGSNGIEWLSNTTSELRIKALHDDPILLITPSRWQRSEQRYSQIFEKREQKQNADYIVVPGGEKSFPSLSNIDQSVLPKNLPVISVSTQPDAIHHPRTGLLNNRQHRGQQWERGAYVSWFDQGEHQFSTTAGLRFHGGKSRSKYASWRLYFGKSRGSSSDKADTIFANKVKLRTLVVHHTDWPANMPLNNSLGFAVCRLLGCDVPESRLAIFYLNGERQGIVYLSEHQSRRQWSERSDTRLKYLFRFKSGNGATDSNAFTETVRQLLRPNTPLTMERVSKLFDLKQLTLHMIAHFYIANADFCQGIAILEDTPKQDRWRYVAWDMDHGFSWYPNWENPKDIPGWEEEGLEKAYKTYASCPRRDIVQRLLKEDSKYRSYFLHQLEDALQNKLTKPVLTKEIKKMTKLLRDGGYGNTTALENYLLEFIDKRPDFLRNEARTRLGPVDVDN